MCRNPRLNLDEGGQSRSEFGFGSQNELSETHHTAQLWIAWRAEVSELETSAVRLLTTLFNTVHLVHRKRGQQAKCKSDNPPPAETLDPSGYTTVASGDGESMFKSRRQAVPSFQSPGQGFATQAGAAEAEATSRETFLMLSFSTSEFSERPRALRECARCVVGRGDACTNPAVAPQAITVKDQRS